MERRHSTTSDSSNDSRQSSCDAETTTSRLGKTLAPKVAVNPLQFVKVGPCDLYRSAQEQLKKVEEIKKAKKVQKDDVEDWQSNLDNWKCSRRKRQEHIIERVVEVKKFELEEHERNRKKSKTFSEMMLERNSRGRKSSLPVYHNDDDDLSELGLSCQKGGSSDTASSVDQVSTDGDTTLKNDSVDKIDKTYVRESSEIVNSPQPPSSNESQEYTYEWAIQNYVNFAETRVKSKSTTNIVDGNNKKSVREYPPIARKPNTSGRADSYLKNIDDKKKTTVVETKKSTVASVPKIDINGRRKLFEQNPQNETTSTKNVKTTPGGIKIKERLMSLEEQKKQSENLAKETKLPIQTERSVKNRLMNIEAISTKNVTVVKKSQVEPITSMTIKDRLNSLSKPDLSSSANKTIVEPSMSIKDRLNSLHSFIAKEPPKTNVDLINANVTQKAEAFKEVSEEKTVKDHEYVRSYSPEDMRKRHFRHRSLDSLDVDHENVASGSFERVQSLEDLDYCQNYPPSTFSGDTDREDSGIHTADVSSSVSQADDYDLHLDNTVIDSHQPPIAEEVRLTSERCCFSFQEPELCHDFGRKETDRETGTMSAANGKIEDRDDSTKIASMASSEEMTSANHLTPENYETANCSNKSDDIRNGTASVEPNQFKGVILDVFSDTPQDCLFNLNPVLLEPPKEKPPPPPLELSDEEIPVSKPKVTCRRLDSTKRIKKEIRQKRSSFLGLDGNDFETYLEPEIELIKPPPDVAALLEEERRLEKQLYRQSICSESDSNQESRDSGVEVDPKPSDAWSHSRNDSDVYGNNSTTSEEDEIMKKEREIIETLEEEEKIRKQDMENKLKLGETLAMKLRELEAKKEIYDWESSQIGDSFPVPQHRQQPAEVPLSNKVEQPCRSEPELTRQERTPRRPVDNINHMMYTQEATRPVALPPQPDWPMMATEARSRESLKPVQMRDIPSRKSLQDLRRADEMAIQYRRSMPNLQDAQMVVQPRRPPPPPPIQPLPPLNHSLPIQSNGECSQQMSRQTLQALSAAPRSRLIGNDTWQTHTRRKQSRPDNCNYQHWLIQEAEHRRITEQQQRQVAASHQPMPRSNVSHHQPAINPQKWGPHSGTYYPENNWSQPHQQSYPVQPQAIQRVPPQPKGKPLPDAVIHTLTQRVQRMNDNNNNRRRHENNNVDHFNHSSSKVESPASKEKMLSVSGKKRCSHCGDELGRGAAMIIESLQLFYHIECFKCCVCCVQLGDGLMGTDVRVRNNKLHCHNCYSSDDGAKFSCV